MIIEFFTTVMLMVFTFWFLWENRRRGSSPPGPLRFPILGTLPQIFAANRISFLALDKLSKQYGDIMSIKLGFVDVVMAASFEAMKDLSLMDETLGRQCEGIWWDRNLQKNQGLGFANNEPWVEMRKFCRDSLRNYGFGSSGAMGHIIMDEIHELVKYMDKQRQQNIEGRIKFTTRYFNFSFSNLMTSIIIGKRFSYDDHQHQKLLEYGHNFCKNGIIGAGILTAYPFLKSVFPVILGYKTQMESIYGMQAVAQDMLDGRRMEDYKLNPRCFADDFLNKIDEDASSSQPLFTDDNFKVVFSDLIQGGTDTIANYINFLILLLTTHQDVQDKLYMEIVNVCGSDRCPNMEDKPRMHYAQAVLLEGHRWGRTLVHGVPKKVTKDFIYRGYTFRKGTTVMVNCHSVFFDEKYWVDPNVFRPERFLDNDGKLISAKSERIIAFGSGKRNCFGEPMARASTFLFITTLCYRFLFQLPRGIKPLLEPMEGISLGPYEYEALVTVRHSL